MLRSNVKDWVILFMIFLLNYGMVMYITYPRFIDLNLNGIETMHEGVTEPAPSFMYLSSAIQSMLEVAFIGEPLELDLAGGWQTSFLIMRHDDLTSGRLKAGLFVLFLFFYVIYIVMALVLLLNFLIAMMGDTYTSAMHSAQTLFRVTYARHILRLELQMHVLIRLRLINLHCGEKVDLGTETRWVHSYRNYEANAEGGGMRGTKPTMFDAAVERACAEDELDDDGGIDPEAVLSKLRDAIVHLDAPSGEHGERGGAILMERAPGGQAEGYHKRTMDDTVSYGIRDDEHSDG